MVKERQEYAKDKEEDKKDESYFKKLKKLSLKGDIESLTKNPIHQPIIEFIKEIDRVSEEINYENESEVTELRASFIEKSGKEYYQDLEIIRTMKRLNTCLNKQIHRLQSFPEASAKVILEMLGIYKKMGESKDGE